MKNIFTKPSRKKQRIDESDLEAMAGVTASVANDVNPYLNTPPTELNRDLKNEKDPAKRKEMQEALNAWRTTVPGPFLKSAEELVKIAKELMR